MRIQEPFLLMCFWRCTPRKANLSSKRGKSGFSLLELLAAILVMAILIGLSVPAVMPLLKASQMNKASGMISDEFNYVRQLALSKNRDVEVRFYKVGGKSNPAKVEYRAFRSFLAGGSAADAKPLTPVKYLPENVIISKDGKFSTLLDYGNAGRSGLAQGQEKLPTHTAAVDYISFMFRATGGTTLSPITPPVGNWFLTLYLEDAPPNADTGIPDNYVNVQLDPVTGRLRTYRP